MTAAAPTSALPAVKALLILDSEGRRIAVKYYTKEWPTVPAQAEFERAVFAKTARTSARGDPEITLMDAGLVLFKSCGDLTFYLIAGPAENEVLMATVLSALVESVSLLLRGAVDKKSALENLDLVLLAVDEVVDRGLILETDPATIAARVSMAGAEGELPLGEQTLAKVAAMAKEQIARSLLK